MQVSTSFVYILLTSQVHRKKGHSCQIVSDTLTCRRHITFHHLVGWGYIFDAISFTLQRFRMPTTNGARPTTSSRCYLTISRHEGPLLLLQTCSKHVSMITCTRFPQRKWWYLTLTRVSKFSCRTAKRPQPDHNRTEKDRTAVASCLASATDQLQVASSLEKSKNRSTTGCNRSFCNRLYVRM
jgi:hypothetical protein